MTSYSVKCYHCGKSFKRSLSEIKRNKKNKRKTFCNLSCAGKYTIKNIPKNKKRWSHLNPSNRKDEYSKFRFFLKVCKKRSKQKKRNINITLQDLKNQWEKQKGVCPYTGWKLIAFRTTGQVLPKTPNRASLDRIDSSKGYVKGNIQFISLIAQYAKNDWNKNVILKFSKSVLKSRLQRTKN